MADSKDPCHRNSATEARGNTGRRLLLALGLCLLVAEGATLTSLAFRGRAQPAPSWDEIEPGDPRVTGVFTVLQRDGLAAALDSLERAAAGDSAVLLNGHQLAHELGRRAQAANAGDASVLGQCRPAFSSGCYHGVVEALVDARGRIEMPELERMCLAAGTADRPGMASECLHGLGHGLLGVTDLDHVRALRHCDAIADERFSASCHAGVFMEAINLEIARLRGARSRSPAARHGDHPEHGLGGAAGPRLRIDPANPHSPCDRIGEPYADACWIFQGFVILRGTGFDVAEALRICGAAPDGRARRCAESVGHQLAGLLQRGDAWIIRECGRGVPAVASWCAAGATLTLNSMDWSGARSASLCRAAPPEWKETCYTSAAATLAFYASPSELGRFCDGVESAWADACRAAAAAASSGRAPDGRPAARSE